ncbi:ImmA/IrrE family metallo-endopeptidase [Enterococcus sp. AZ103]|uniref:ImmA/IrrE family metallo-endopeptidase n=1 Tax=Enterococcus sp. AZ103 TaxID=2774628 RepID=UPI003F27E737
MDKEIDDLVRQLNTKIVYDNSLDKVAHNIILFNIIVVNDSYTLFEQQKAILHELGHTALHRNDYKSYKEAFSLHSAMEHEANEYMVRKVLDKYICETELEPRQVNRIQFIESCDLDPNFEDMVQSLLIEYQI